MKPKLKENPRDWILFTLSSSIVLLILGWIGQKRGYFPLSWFYGLALGAGLLLLTGLVQPQVLRPLYRVGMTLAFYVGQMVGRILLVTIFLFVVTPLGIFLRLLGKDLLDRSLSRKMDSYWKPGPASPQFDRQF